MERCSRAKIPKHPKIKRRKGYTFRWGRHCTLSHILLCGLMYDGRRLGRKIVVSTIPWLPVISTSLPVLGKDNNLSKFTKRDLVKSVDQTGGNEDARRVYRDLETSNVSVRFKLVYEE